MVIPRPKSSELSLEKIASPKKFSPDAEHELISDARKHLLKSRDVKDNEHLNPYKKLMMHILVSRESMDSILSLINKLIIALESKGYPVVVAPEYLQLYRNSVTDKELDD